MQVKRISVRCIVIAASAIAWMPSAGAQQPYPAKLVRMVVPFPAGGGTDVLARSMSSELAVRLGQPVIVDNRGGAQGAVGIEHVARSAPDGHTILFATSAFSVLPAVHPKLPYDSQRDFAPVARLSSVPHYLVAHPSLPVRTVKDLVNLAKSRPDQINFASQGVTGQLAAELFKMQTGVRMTHVPYKGAGLALTALLSGEVSVLFSVPIVAQPHIRSGRLRLLAVTSTERDRLFPETPTVSESGLPGYEVLQWHGVWVPSAVPPRVIERLSTEFSSIVGLPVIVERMRAEGALPVSSTPRAFAEFVAAEIAKWAKVAKLSGARLE